MLRFRQVGEIYKLPKNQHVLISESSHAIFLDFSTTGRNLWPCCEKVFSGPMKRTIQRMSSALPAVFYLPSWRPCPFVIRTSRTIVLFADYELACLQIPSREMRCRSAHWCVLGSGTSRASHFILGGACQVRKTGKVRLSFPGQCLV